MQEKQGKTGKWGNLLIVLLSTLIAVGLVVGVICLTQLSRHSIIR